MQWGRPAPLVIRPGSGSHSSPAPSVAAMRPAFSRADPTTRVVAEGKLVCCCVCLLRRLAQLNAVLLAGRLLFGKQSFQAG